ncbi:MAG: GTPase Era [Calditrichia bacterium]
MKNNKSFKSGYVALVGKPNVGKSTLLNQFLQFKLSIVTKKPQTTRKKVLGILSGENYQIIFIDTPGILEPRYDLQKIMMKYVHSALEDADVIVYLVDVTAVDQEFSEKGEFIPPPNKPVVLALNKIDLIQKDQLLPIIDQFRRTNRFQSFVPVSALKNSGLQDLLQEIICLLPENPPYFPPEYVTDQQERFFVSEIIREKIFLRFGEEIPYSCHVQIEEFKERPGHKDFIRAVIYVERNSQKAILIGKKGQALKRVGQEARQEIEAFLNRPVYLELYVKVLEDWRKKEKQLHRLGY